MKHNELAPYLHHSAQIDPAKLWVRTTDDKIQQASKAIAKPTASNNYGDAQLDLTPDDGGSGLWIPYQAQSAVYGYLGDKTWAASGPYSGCYFVVGRHEGKIYAAHVSCETPNDPVVQAWEASPMAKDVLFKKKISPSPLATFDADCICFADVSGGKVTVTRVDIRVPASGKMSGPIFAVNAIESD